MKKKFETKYLPSSTFFSLYFFTVKAAAYRIFVKSSLAFTNVKNKHIENSNSHSNLYSQTARTDGMKLHY